MANLVFISGLGVAFALIFAWSFRELPGEKWQIAASVPIARNEAGSWTGVNLTFYGLLNASANTTGVALVLILMGAVSISMARALMVVGMVLVVCVPASKVVARIVEKKLHTFTVGGASFVGIIGAPWIIELFNRLPGQGDPIPTMSALAAISIGYAFGEGMGRLACISFGCCYGKLVSESPPLVRRLFERRHFIFHGKTKKIAYAGGMDGKKVIPIQAITSVVFVAAGLTGMVLFVNSRMLTALVLTTVVTQGWRAVSEVLRADYRGEGKLSAYQVMAMISTIYVMVLPLLLPMPAPDAPSLVSPSLPGGLAGLWSPTPMIFLQVLWLSIFLLTGRSMVTGAVLSFHVRKDRI